MNVYSVEMALAHVVTRAAALKIAIYWNSPMVVVNGWDGMRYGKGSVNTNRSIRSNIKQRSWLKEHNIWTWNYMLSNFL